MSETRSFHLRIGDPPPVALKPYSEWLPTPPEELHIGPRLTRGEPTLHIWQLRLVVEIPLFTGNSTSQVVVWDFWTIYSIMGFLKFLWLSGWCEPPPPFFSPFALTIQGLETDHPGCSWMLLTICTAQFFSVEKNTMFCSKSHWDPHFPYHSLKNFLEVGDVELKISFQTA